VVLFAEAPAFLVYVAANNFLSRGGWSYFCLHSESKTFYSASAPTSQIMKIFKSDWAMTLQKFYSYIHASLSDSFA